MAKRVSTPPAEARKALQRMKMELAARAANDEPMFLADIAKALGITRQAISGWNAIPAEWVRQISEITGIPPWRLRPDLYDAPAPAPRRRITG